MAKAKWSSLKNADILEAGDSALDQLKEKFKYTKNPERLVQYYLYGYFRAIGIPMSVEYPVDSVLLKKKDRAITNRIDFRYEGDNKALLELEKIRRTRSNYEGLAYNNRTELLKLMQQTRGQAKRRILLILDFRDRDPVDEKKLAEAYQFRWKQIIRKLGRAWVKKFSSVTVLYAHHNGNQFSVVLNRDETFKITRIREGNATRCPF